MKKLYAIVCFSIAMLLAVDFLSFAFDVTSPMGRSIEWYRSAQYWTFDRDSWRAYRIIKAEVAGDEFAEVDEIFGEGVDALCVLTPYMGGPRLAEVGEFVEAETFESLPRSIPEDVWYLLIAYRGDRRDITFKFRTIDFGRILPHLALSVELPPPCFESPSGLRFQRTNDTITLTERGAT